MAAGEAAAATAHHAATLSAVARLLSSYSGDLLTDGACHVGGVSGACVQRKGAPGGPPRRNVAFGPGGAGRGIFAVAWRRYAIFAPIFDSIALCLCLVVVQNGEGWC